MNWLARIRVRLARWFFKRQPERLPDRMVILLMRDVRPSVADLARERRLRAAIGRRLVERN